jgi:hypothetical protein
VIFVVLRNPPISKYCFLVKDLFIFLGVLVAMPTPTPEGDAIDSSEEVWSGKFPKTELKNKL